MAEFKPLGSEKLNGDEKLKRILELTYFNNKPKKIVTESVKAEIIKESKCGGFYAVVREKDGYYVKIGLTENKLDYIGGLFMKNKNKFSSYAEALKRLELVKGQDELNEATKYVLKQNKPKEESFTPEPPPAPSPESEPMPSSEPMPYSEPDMSAPLAPESDGEQSPEATGSSKKSDYMAELQKFAGKLGQELRDQKERLESDDIKYVLNMVISAVDLNKLDDEDIEEIGDKFDREDEIDDGSDYSPEPDAEPTPDEDLGEDIEFNEKKEFLLGKGYTHFAILKSNNKIVDGWDYSNLFDKYSKTFDNESIRYYTKGDLTDNYPDHKLSDFKIVSRKKLEKNGVDVSDTNNWYKQNEPTSDEDLSEVMNMMDNFINSEFDMQDDVREFDISKMTDLDDLDVVDEEYIDEEEEMTGGNYKKAYFSSDFIDNSNGYNNNNSYKTDIESPEDENFTNQEFNENEDIELDLEEMKNEINKSIGETLSKYFKK
jgi:hypothetical protein